MSDPDYSNREIDRMFAHIAGELLEIKKQTTYTNGKVRKLIVAMIAIGFFCAGLGLEQIKPLLMLLL